MRGIVFSATTDIWTPPNNTLLISHGVSYIIHTLGSWRLVSLDTLCIPEAHTGQTLATKLIVVIKSGGLDLAKGIITTVINASCVVQDAANNHVLSRQACTIHPMELLVKRFVGGMRVNGPGGVGTGVGTPWSPRVRGNRIDGATEQQ